MRRELDYICMQPTRQGQASYAHVNEIVAGLRRRGWNVRLVEPTHPRPGRADGLRRALAAATSQLAYLARCRVRPAPFVYIRAHFLALPVAIVARLAGSVVVQEINGPATDTYDAWPQLRPLRGLLAFVSRFQIIAADAVVVVTPGLVGYMQERTGRRTGYSVIGNGANVDLFRPAAGPSDPDARRYVVFIGALASWQGVDTIVAAAGDATWPDDVDLLIAGDGVERHRVVEAARAQPHIRWLGTIPYDDAPALVAGSLAALVPMSDIVRSRWGLSPLKLYEAMACGVPVIASDLPELGDTVRRHDCGVTFLPGDHVALARAVARLSGDPDEAHAMGARGHAAAQQLYSWDARAAQTQDVLLEVARRRSARRPLGPTTG